MLREEFDQLPLAVDLDAANKAVGIGRTSGYALAKAGVYPVAVQRIGNRYRVLKADLARYLGIDA